MTNEEAKLKIAGALDALDKIEETIADVMDRGPLNNDQEAWLDTAWDSVLAAVKALARASGGGE
jgi:hypothetical protein